MHRPLGRGAAQDLPLVLVGLYAKARRQWSLTDFTLLEALLRYSLNADRAIAAHGGWIVPESLSAPYVPGPSQVFTSWFPAPVAPLDLSHGGEVAVGTFTHLVWSTVAGLGVGVLWRAKGWWKPLALLPLSAAVAHHTLNNYAATHARSWRWAPAAVAAVETAVEGGWSRPGGELSSPSDGTGSVR